MLSRLLVNLDPRYWAPRVVALVSLLVVAALVGGSVLLFSGHASVTRREAITVATLPGGAANPNRAPIGPGGASVGKGGTYSQAVPASQGNSPSLYTTTGGNGVGSISALPGVMPDPSGPTSSGLSGASVVPISVPGKHQIALYMDGWSMKNLNPKLIGISLSNIGASSPTQWRPVTSADVSELMADAPGLLRDVAARMISPASAVTCTTSGCTDPQGAIDPSWFVDPTKIPGLGAEYQGYGITHTLYVTVVNVPTSESFWLRYGNSAIIVSPPPAQHTSSSGGQTPATSGDGYLAERYLVGSGFGQVFFTSPSWLETPAQGYSWKSFSENGALSGGDMDLASTGTIFTGGLGSDALSATGWLAEQMTYATSPTTGCGPGVLCVPGIASPAAVTVSSHQAGLWCTSKSQAGVNVVQATWRYNFKVPTNQYGMWLGKTPAQFANSNGSDPYFWTGTPPLSSGPTTLYQHLAYVTTGHTPNLIGLYGVTGPMSDTQSASAIAQLALGSDWKSC